MLISHNLPPNDSFPKIKLWMWRESLEQGYQYCLLRQTDTHFLVHTYLVYCNIRTYFSSIIIIAYDLQFRSPFCPLLLSASSWGVFATTSWILLTVYTSLSIGLSVCFHVVLRHWSWLSYCLSSNTSCDWRRSSYRLTLIHTSHRGQLSASLLS